MRVFFLRLCTKFEVRWPFRSGDMSHFRSQNYVGRLTLTFELYLEKLLHIIVHWTPLLTILVLL